MAFLPLHKAGRAKPYRPLVVDDPKLCHEWITDPHIRRQSGEVHALGCYVLNEIVLTGRGHLFKDGQLLATEDILPKYWRNLIENGTINLQQELILPERYIEPTCLVAIGHGSSVYGHVLIETVLRVRLLQELGLRDYRIILSDLAPTWVTNILVVYLRIRPDQIEIYRPDHERLRLRTAIIPTHLRQAEHFHPATQSLVRSIVRDVSKMEKPNSSPSKRIAISRDRFTNIRSIQRHTANVHALWDRLANNHDFTIVRPEELSWAEQIHAFRQARVVLGEYGSGLHNAIFSKPRTIVASVGFLNFTQSAIGALCEHRQTYLTGLDGRAPMSIETPRFDKWISEILKQAENE